MWFVLQLFKLKIATELHRTSEIHIELDPGTIPRNTDVAIRS